MGSAATVATPMAAPSERLYAAIHKWKAMRDGADYLTVDQTDFIDFAIFIGKPHNPYKRSAVLISTDDPEVMKIVDMINGENGNTVLRIIKAKNEGKQDDEL